MRTRSADPEANGPERTVETFGNATQLEEPFGVNDGPDGWLWFTDKSRGTLGRVFAGT